MATSGAVKPNRRGVKSRELVLDAAERVMAEHGYDGASVERVVEETGIPKSSVYHYFGSKDGILLAVMERVRSASSQSSPPPRHASAPPNNTLQPCRRRSPTRLSATPTSFLRLSIVLATQPTPASNGDVHAVVNRVRATALQLLREQLALAYGDEPDDPVIDQLARFALAATDGAFIASQTDRNAKLERTLLPWAGSITALRRSLREAAD
jgi:AcrR family transcriptional regulator